MIHTEIRREFAERHLLIIYTELRRVLAGLPLIQTEVGRISTANLRLKLADGRQRF